MPLPRFQRFRPVGAAPVRRDELAQLERNAGDFADGLTGPGGLLSRGLTFREHFRGAVREVKGFEQPDGGTPEDERPRVTIGEGLRGAPVAVWCVDALADDGTHLSMLPVRWKEASAGQFQAVRVLEVVGLPSGQPYRLLLFILAE